MDEIVRDAMAKWPDVPAVFGWLSLSARANWLLHPRGDATEGSTGEAITNGQILTFIARNYASDPLGRWFFQNGPQRVYVRIDAAPLIIYVDDATGILRTHLGKDIQDISHWWIDGEGRLFISSEQGPGLVIDKDLPRLIDKLTTRDGQTVGQWWSESDESSTEVLDPTGSFRVCSKPALLTRLDTNIVLGEALGFCANPKASTDCQM